MATLKAACCTLTILCTGLLTTKQSPQTGLPPALPLLPVTGACCNVEQLKVSAAGLEWISN